MTNVFKSYESAFYRFMISRGMTRKTSSDYISRLRFLSQTYLLDENLSFDDNTLNLISKNGKFCTVLLEIQFREFIC